MTPEASSIRILVSDDEEDILELLGEYLRARGYHVHTASDGIDALDIVRSGAVDLVLTDMKMPTLGGLELLEEVRRLPHPVAAIVMTGFGTVESALRAMKEGAYDYILKPFKLKEVHAAIVRASERVQKEKDAVRMREVLSFYEHAQALDSTLGLGRLYGMLASVAMHEAEAEEVAVWTAGSAGWEAVARGGTIGTLASLDPDLVIEPLLEAGVLAHPIVAAGKRVGVLAVAGGPDKPPPKVERLRLFARVVGEAMARSGWTPS